MATYDWPVNLRAASFEWGAQKAGFQFRSPLNGFVQSIDLASDSWVVSVTIPARLRREAGLAEAFFTRLAGGVHRARIGMWVRPIPFGTMRGAPTIAVNVARGASVIPIQTTAGATLLAGDLFKVANQLFMAFANTTANGSGRMDVPVSLNARAALSAGTAVQWDRPTIECIAPAMSARFAHRVIAEGAMLDLEEAA